MPNYDIEAYGKKYTVESAQPLSDEQILGYVQKVQPPESFGQEFRRTRKEQMEASDVRNLKPDLMGHPLQTVLQALGTVNYPLAYTGIGPLMDVAARRFIEKPITESLPKPPEKIQQAFPWTKAIPEIIGKTGSLAAETFLPGPTLARISEMFAPAKVLSKLRKGEELAGEAARVGEGAETVRDVKIPKVEGAQEAVVGKTRQAERALKRGEAELEKFPEKISPKKFSTFEAGAEYGGTTTQAKPRLDELGSYGQAAKGASAYFKKRYDPIREQAAAVKIPVQDLDEIKQGVFEGVQRQEFPIPERDLALQIMNQKLTPTQTAAAERAMVEARKAGKPFTAGDLAGILEAEGPEGLSGKQLLDRVQILRDQGRQSSTDLVEHLRNDLADRYLDRLKQASPGLGPQLEQVNAEYRRSREYFGRYAIPRQTADQHASDIITAMFGPGKGRVERARTMREFLPKEQFDSYVRSFHESVFDPANIKETRAVWEKLSPEVKAEMYGKPLATELDRIMTGIAKDEKRIGQLGVAGKNIEKYGGKLEKEAAGLEKQKLKLAQDAKKAGYVFDPESALGKIEETRTSRGGRAGMLGFGAYLGYEHLALGLLNLTRGRAMIGPAMFQLGKGLLYLSPAFIPSASRTVKGAKVIADILNAASTQQQIAAGWAFRTWLSKNGSSLKSEMQKVGITRTPKADVLDASPENQNPTQR